jgi:hypothetical protein
MRISARPRDLDGTSRGVRRIYRGAVREIRDGWVADDRGQQEFRVTVRLVDRFADMAAVDLPEQPLEGLGDTTDERVARLMDRAEIDPYYGLLASCEVEHQSTNLARNLLDEAQVAAESEVGALYVDREGFIVLRPAHGTAPTSRETDVQMAWANAAAVGGYPTVPPLNFGSGQDLDDVVNQVSMSRAGGTAYTTSDAESILAFGLRTYQRFDLTCRYDTDVQFAADWRLDQLRRRTQRVDSLRGTVLPLMDNDALAALLDVELGDKHYVSWDDGEREVTGTMHVQGVTHRVTGDAWEVKVDLWAYAGEGLVALALWGTAEWGIDVWQIG